MNCEIGLNGTKEIGMDSSATSSLSQAKPDTADITTVLKQRWISPPSGRVASLLNEFGAQLGEIGWHVPQAAPAESTEQSIAFADQMCSLAKEAGLSRPRILELGAYINHSAHIAASRLGGTAVTHDISAASVRLGQQRAKDAGIEVENWAVAGDFHSLPFADGAFDLVFIASSVHHTYRPWLVMQEMIRVTRPGGVIHIENEPITRTACLFQFRGNRPESFTAYERELERLGLTTTVSSPFPGTRAELLFGMIENDRIPLKVYEDNLRPAGRVLEWTYKEDVPFGSFEAWLMEGRTAQECADKLFELLNEAAEAFTVEDLANGFTLPGADEVWPLAYRLPDAIEAAKKDEKARAELFGTGLRASIVKSGEGQIGTLFSRGLREDDGVFVDDSKARGLGVTFSNVMADPEVGQFGPDWHIMQEASGAYTLANEQAVCTLPVDLGPGFLILRAYSVKADKPYRFTVLRDDEVVYSLWVVSSVSHLAKIYMEGGERIQISHHDDDGLPVDVRYFTRLLPRFVRA